MEVEKFIVVPRNIRTYQELLQMGKFAILKAGAVFPCRDDLDTAVHKLCELTKNYRSSMHEILSSWREKTRDDEQEQAGGQQHLVPEGSSP